MIHLYLLVALLLPDLPQGVVARGGGFEVTDRQYHAYLTASYRGDELFDSLLEQMVKESVIRGEARKRKLTVSKEELERRLRDLDLRFKASSGGQSGLNEYMEEQEIDEEEFYRALNLSIVHEAMARADFGIGVNEEISVEKLNIWLKDRVGKTPVETNGAAPGVVAVINGDAVTEDVFGSRLFALIPRKKATSLLTEMIGIELIRRKAGEMDVTLEDKDLDREIGEREAVLQAKAGFSSITYEGYLKAARGQTVEQLKESDKFQGEVLLKKICESLHHEAYLQDFFDENRAFFNRRYGKAVQISTIFLKAVKFPNQFINRKYDEAREELEAIKARLANEEVTFSNMARIYSEHESRKNGGDLGFIAPGTPGLEEIAGQALLAGVGDILGPFDTDAGCHLIEVTGRRDDPEFEQIRGDVVREARQRYYVNLQKEADIERRY